jgi:hypothetical protein
MIVAVKLGTITKLVAMMQLEKRLIAKIMEDLTVGAQLDLLQSLTV